MQDRSPPTRQIFLLRTAGPYIGSKADIEVLPTDVRFAIKSGHRQASVALLAARRWQDELVASAAAFGDLRAIAKLQILRQTQPHFG
jgi:hypothetical protein